MIVRVLLLMVSAVVITACSSSDNSADSSPEPPVSCSVENQNQFVYDVLLDTYLWYQQVPDLNPSDFASPEELLEYVVDAVELDRFSYISSAESYQNYFEEGTYIGFGFSSVINEAEDALILRYVFNDSPAGEAQLTRGDQITAIDGVTVADLISQGTIDDAFGEAEEGISRTLTIVNKNDVQFDVELVKTLVTMNTVLSSEVIEYQDKRYGYLVFSGFIEPSVAELQQAFEQFVVAQVDDIILDLRYNGGGRVSVANKLASLIGGGSTIGKVFTRYFHNDKYTHWNSATNFMQQNTAGWQSLYVITTGSSCSASELTINSLNPFVDVKLIGSKTCGKPVGMYGAEFCEKRIQPIEFQTTNHDNEGDYFDGMSVDCTAADDLTRDFADVSEGMLAATLELATNNACAVTKVSMDKRSEQDKVPFATSPFNINQ